MARYTTGYLLSLVVLVGVRASLALSGLPPTPADPLPHHARHTRQLHRLLDPFGLLGKAGEAVNGAVQGVQGAVEGLGKTLDQGAQHVSKMFEDGASSFDSVFQNRMGQVHAGLEEAGKVATIVSEDLVDSVSSLVSNHLQGPTEDQMMRREGMVDGFLRMVGIDPSQMGLMVLNVLIFLAEMITSSLVGDNNDDIAETRAGESSMLSWILRRNPFKIDAMLSEAQDPELPRTIIEKLVETTGDDTACLQLLVCKMSPVVWGVQRSVKQSAQARAMDQDAPDQGLFQTLYSSLPELDDFMEFSASCEHQFPACPLLNLSQFGF
ncbi:uncharacterized protein LOC121855064 [Homarus americanus]|uniref:Uncharacterized protein n=1 Tax=Homarus americanus TaxID=6706 RepID=A0A8J5JCB6_HOMAM|nr:uncharacterized protein LOC121855064 [Homarus americanus]KAG7155415.1 hypothetical protein Hamer_G023702 [Homarus americanus]